MILANVLGRCFSFLGRNIFDRRSVSMAVMTSLWTGYIYKLKKDNNIPLGGLMWSKHWCTLTMINVPALPERLSHVSVQYKTLLRIQHGVLYFTSSCGDIDWLLYARQSWVRLLRSPFALCVAEGSQSEEGLQACLNCGWPRLQPASSSPLLCRVSIG